MTGDTDLVGLDWLPYSGAGNPVPGRIVQWRNADGAEGVYLSDDVAGLGAPLRGGRPIIAFRVVGAPITASEAGQHNGPPALPWRCFHCDDVFPDACAARDHFGHDEGATPACKIKGGEIGLVQALRRAEKDASDAWFALQNESSTTAKAFRAMQGRHQQQLTAMEQLGYERGLADAKAHPEDLGLAPIVAAAPVPG